MPYFGAMQMTQTKLLNGYAPDIASKRVQSDHFEHNTAAHTLLDGGPVKARPRIHVGRAERHWHSTKQNNRNNDETST